MFFEGANGWSWHGYLSSVIGETLSSGFEISVIERSVTHVPDDPAWPPRGRDSILSLEEGNDNEKCILNPGQVHIF